MFKYLWKNKLALIIILLALWLVPSTIGVPEQNRTETIITAVGIDKLDTEYEVSVQYIVPHGTESPASLQIASQKGESVGMAIEKLNLQIGKLSGFAHCKFLVFNDEAGKEDLTKIFDYFLRQKTNTNNISLINTKDSAKDLLNISNNLNSDLYSFLNNNGYSNELKDYQDVKTLGDFYMTYFSPIKCMLVNIIDVEEESSSSDSQQGQSGSGGGESDTKASGSSNSSGGSSAKQGKSESGKEDSSKSASSQSQSGGGQKSIANNATMLVLKDSKSLLKLDEQTSNGMSWFNPNIKKKNFKVKNYSDKDIKDADFIIDLHNKISLSDVYFKDGKPYYKLKLILFVRTSQITSQNLKQADYEILQRRFSEDFKNAMRESVLSEIKLAEQNFKQNKYDVIDCFNKFYKFKTSELKQFLKTIENDEDFISNVNFEYEINFVQSF